MNHVDTDFLTPKSSFLTGMGTVLNLAGNYFIYNSSKTAQEADERAIASDWKILGQDMRTAIKRNAKSQAA
jgi:hypothetical protein